MFTKTTLALALIIGSASVALSAESDPNLLNRYPGYNMTKQFGGPVLQTRNVGLTGGFVAKSIPQSYIDRASFSTGQ
jgi:hypothetical protein